MKTVSLILDILCFILFIACSIIGFVQGNITAGLGWATATIVLIRAVLTQTHYDEY